MKPTLRIVDDHARAAILAAIGLIIWIIYLATDSDALRWVGFAILLVVATLGFTMARLWRQERS